jgi:hypothetical protein
LILWAILSCGVVVVATIVTQVKDEFYCDWFPMDMFFPLAIEVFKCLHEQALGVVEVFKCLHEQALGVVVGEGSSRLNILSGSPPPFLI